MGELMRTVGRLEEAKRIVALRDGWTYEKVPTPRIDLSLFEEAPF